MLSSWLMAPLAGVISCSCPPPFPLLPWKTPALPSLSPPSWKVVSSCWLTSFMRSPMAGLAMPLRMPPGRRCGWVKVWLHMPSGASPLRPTVGALLRWGITAVHCSSDRTVHPQVKLSPVWKPLSDWMPSTDSCVSLETTTLWANCKSNLNQVKHTLTPVFMRNSTGTIYSPSPLLKSTQQKCPHFAGRKHILVLVHSRYKNTYPHTQVT